MHLADSVERGVRERMHSKLVNHLAVPRLVPPWTDRGSPSRSVPELRGAFHAEGGPAFVARVAASRCIGTFRQLGRSPALVSCRRLLVLLALVTAANGATKPHPELIAGYGQLPIYFEANRGQADSQVQFLARGQGYTFLLSPTKAVMALNRPEASERRSVGASRRSHAARSHAPTLPRSDAVNIIHMEFAGASGPSRVVGLEELPGQVNYFIGNDAAQWRRGIPTFAKVKYEQMYPGVALICYGNQRQLEYDFVLAPGADPSVVSLHFDGVDQLEIDAQGDLILHTSSGNLHQHKPLIYQTEQSLRREIAGGYVLKDSHTAAFQVAAYDCSKPLVIDPVLNYSTYLGGRNLDVGWDIAVDPAGYAYLAGESLSPDLATVSAFQPKYAGGFSDGTNLVGGDAFVAKLDPNGGRGYVTYLGGKGDEAALGIVVDAAGEEIGRAHV